MVFDSKSGPVVREPATTDNFQVGDKKQYLTGHIVMGGEALVHTVLPLILGQFWWKPKFEDDYENPWFDYAWKAMQAGGVIATGLQLLFFPFTFMDLHLWERVGYVLLWVFHGTGGGILSTTTVIAYFITDLIEYEHDTNFSKKNTWITLVIYIAFQIKSIFLAHKFFPSMVFYMLGPEINKLCDKYDRLCNGFGAKYWWAQAKEEQICAIGGCSDSSDDSTPDEDDDCGINGC